MGFHLAERAYTPSVAFLPPHLESHLLIIPQMSSGISSFFLAMAMNTSVQEKAQLEIDLVCESQGRLPTFADKPSLPYVEAVILEVLRWGAITPLGLPHRFTGDESYEGLRFRKDMYAFANIA